MDRWFSRRGALSPLLLFKRHHPPAHLFRINGSIKGQETSWPFYHLRGTLVKKRIGVFFSLIAIGLSHIPVLQSAPRWPRYCGTAQTDIVAGWLGLYQVVLVSATLTTECYGTNPLLLEPVPGIGSRPGMTGTTMGHSDMAACALFYIIRGNGTINNSRG